MSLIHRTAALARPRRLMAAACAAAALSAHATPFELTHSGWFSTAEALNLQSDSSRTYFNAATPSILQARFDDTSPNLEPPSPPTPPPFAGFRAYAPTSITLYVRFAGRFTANGTDNQGLSVAIFDRSSFMPGRYGVGFIIDSEVDGAGIVGDFKGASPDFTAPELTVTTFADFAGVGHCSGACSSGFPPSCPHLVTPIVLRVAGNASWKLPLATFEADLPAERMNMAAIAAVPEPSTYGLMLAAHALAFMPDTRYADTCSRHRSIRSRSISASPASSLR